MRPFLTLQGKRAVITSGTRGAVPSSPVRTAISHRR